MRTFIAIPMPLELHQKFSELENKLKPISGRSIRWVEPAIIHLTLKFLGEANPVQVDGISEILQEIAGYFSTFQIEIKGLGVFPAWNRPRVFWTGLLAPQVLFDLQKQVDEQTAALGFPSENRPFSPHLTLGRANELIPPQLLTSLKEVMIHEKDRSFGLVPVDRIILFQSILQPSGPVYKPISSHNLKCR